MKMEAILKIFLILLVNNQIVNSQDKWKIIFKDENGNNLEDEKKNYFNITKGNYKSFKIDLEKSENTLSHFNATLKLNNSDLKVLPNEILLNTEKSLNYSFELGIPCNYEAQLIEFNFEIEVENEEMKDLIELYKCQANLELTAKTISFDILNQNGITNNLYGKIFIKQDFKNFEDLNIVFEKGFQCKYYNYFEDIKNIVIKEYNEDPLIYYSIVKPNVALNKSEFVCEISGENLNRENNKCFIVNKEKITIKYFNKTTDFSYKQTFFHNSIVSSYINNSSKNYDNNDSLSLFFHSEVDYFLSYCVIQEVDNNLLSNHEILNQRLNPNNKNILVSFNMSGFNNPTQENEIIFNNLDKSKNYKIKCIFDFFDNETKIELTYGNKMQIPFNINFNETKINLGKDCYREEYMKNMKLDTRYCDIINQRLILSILDDSNLKYKLQSFNYTDFEIYTRKNSGERITHLKNIIDNNETIISTVNEQISSLSDYLFLIDCNEDQDCQNEKDIIFKEILIKYKNINLNEINIKNNQSVLNDILLFNNIIENTDTINYDNFEFMVNEIFKHRNLFFSNAAKEYNQFLTNYLLLIFDKFISIVTKFKTIYSNKFKIDNELNIYKNEILIKFYNYFIQWISHGMITREDRLLQFCKNIITNYVELPVKSNIKTIIDSEMLIITGFDTEESKELYKNIYSAGAISYKKFPLFPLQNKKSEATTLFLYTELRENFEDDDIAYSEAFKIIFKNKSSNNYCYMWNNDYFNENKELVNNYVSTEYLDKDGEKYNINCISRVMISPMTIILGQSDIKGSLFKEGINILSVIVIIFITISLILISFPFYLSKYYKKQSESAKKMLNELN